MEGRDMRRRDKIQKSQTHQNRNRSTTKTKTKKDMLIASTTPVKLNKELHKFENGVQENKHIAYETMKIIEDKKYVNLRNNVVSLEGLLNNMSFKTYSPQDIVDIKDIRGKYLLEDTQYIVRKQSTLETFFQEDKINIDRFVSQLSEIEYMNFKEECFTEDKICILNLANPEQPAGNFIEEEQAAEVILEGMDNLSNEEKRIMLNLSLNSNSNTLDDTSSEEELIRDLISKRTSIMEDKIKKNNKDSSPKTSVASTENKSKTKSKLKTKRQPRKRLHPEPNSSPNHKDKNDDISDNIDSDKDISLSYIPENDRICILNFASARNPGGGFLKGKTTQEETLAKCSALYESIYDSDMYKVNNDDNNSCLYSHHMIYSKDVPIFRDDNMELLNVPGKADFITAPAVNTKEALKRGVSQQIINNTMDMRIDRIFSLCVLNNVDILILGAWGCGIYGGDFKVISSQFMYLLSLKYYGYFKKVIFSVTNDEDYYTMKLIDYQLIFE